MDAIWIVAVSLGVGTLLGREAWCFLRWKRSLGRLERNEWSRMVKALREE